MNEVDKDNITKKRILFVIHGFPPNAYGGIETHTFHLAIALLKRYEVFVFTRVEDKSKDDFTTYQEDLYGIHIMNVVNNFKWQSNKFTDRFLCNQIDKIFENYIIKIKPDIVHIQHLVGLSGGIVDITEKYKIPVVLSLHDYWFGCHRLNLVTNLGLICQKSEDPVYCVDCVLKPPIFRFFNSKGIHWFKSRYIARIKKSIPENFVKDELIQFIDGLSDSITDNIKAVISRRNYMKYILSKCQYLICPSPWVESVYSQFGFDYDNYLIIPPGCKLPSYKELNEGKPDVDKKVFHVGYAGAILRHKGIHILIKAINILNKKGLTKDKLILSIYGKGSDRIYLDELKKMVEGSNVEFKGGYQHEKLNEIMSQMDLIVVPSLWHETYSVIIREALLCGIPIITTDLPAQSDAITDKKSGRLTYPEDPFDLAEKIEYAITSPDFIKNAKDYIKNFEIKRIPSIEGYSNRVSEIYDELTR
jgi:glycosyltransferase involved in cell wall biosynthesis